MSAAGSLPDAGRRSRIVPVALVVLAHLVLAALLLRHGAVRDDDGGPVSYIAFALIPAPAPAQPVAQAEPPPRTLAPPVRRMPPLVRRHAAPLPVMAQPPAAQAPAAVAENEPSAQMQIAQMAQVAQPGIDMAALRAAARRIDSERAPAPGDAETLRATGDSKLARAVREAKRPDCQKKYSGGSAANLVLLIPLAIETITDKGCKW